MKRFLLFLYISLWSIALMAEDFKVGEAKYTVLENDGVELADFKKATGTVVLSDKVVDPKTGHQYNVVAIGKGAFKKSQLTDVTIPASVTSIGKEAFKECAQLTTVKLPDTLSEIPAQCFAKCPALKRIDVNLRYISNVGSRAFEGSGISVAPSYKLIDNDGVSFLYSIYTPEHPAPARIPALISASAQVDAKSDDELAIEVLDEVNKRGLDINNIDRTVLNSIVKEVVKRGKIDFSVCRGSSVFIFEDPRPDDLMLELALFIINQKSFNPISLDLNGDMKTIHLTFVSNPATHYIINSTDNTFYFGAEVTRDDVKLIEKRPHNFAEAIDIGLKNKERKIFLLRLEKWMNAAIDDPKKILNGNIYLHPSDVAEYNTDFSKAISILSDSIYLAKPTLSSDELEILAMLGNDNLVVLGAECGIKKMYNLLEWAECDMLNDSRNPGSPEHKEIYERLLKIGERILKLSNSRDYPYAAALQLAGLCGTGRWKEASAYFPKVHRAATENGIYGVVPYEITYMQKKIKEKGFNAATPTYGKSGGKSGGKSIGKKSSGSDSLFEFFVTEAIEAGVKHYEKKRAERKAREMFYKSIGLDKKGRPKK